MYIVGHFIKNKRWAQESKTNEDKNDEKKREVTNEKKMNTHTKKNNECQMKRKKKKPGAFGWREKKKNWRVEEEQKK